MCAFVFTVPFPLFESGFSYPESKDNKGAKVKNAKGGSKGKFQLTVMNLTMSFHAKYEYN